uniref:Uncharacterized protein n=1 Tax=Romanomermis culicivorax TaxID=13658 RepID=A0A915IFD2_ROMCU
MAQNQKNIKGIIFDSPLRPSPEFKYTPVAYLLPGLLSISTRPIRRESPGPPRLHVSKNRMEPPPVCRPPPKNQGPIALRRQRFRPTAKLAWASGGGDSVHKKTLTTKAVRSKRFDTIFLSIRNIVVEFFFEEICLPSLNENGKSSLLPEQENVMHKSANVCRSKKDKAYRFQTHLHKRFAAYSKKNRL